MVADIRKKKGFAASAKNSMVLVAVASRRQRCSHEYFFDNPVTTSLILRTTSQRIRSGTYSSYVIENMQLREDYFLVRHN